MIFSNDQKILFLGVSKTGTTTANTILAPYGIALRESITYRMSCMAAPSVINNFDESKIEKIYLFWRDPVERFISGINYLRSPGFITLLIRYRPQWFPGVDLSPYTDGSKPTPNSPPMPPLPQEIFDACLALAPSVTPEQIFNDTEIMTNNIVMVRQSFWHNFLPPGKATAFDFANFEVNLKTIAIEFGAPSSIQIPVLNESNHITNSLSAELEAAVKAYYADDYAYKPPN